MSEAAAQTTPQPEFIHQERGFWEQSPEAIGQYFADMNQTVRDNRFSADYLRETTWLLDTIADKVRDEDGEHFLKAFGLRFVPSYAINLEDIDDATGGELTTHGWEGWMQRLTGQQWGAGTVGRHVTTLDMNLFHGPSYNDMIKTPFRSLSVHENVHANGILLFDFLNEGIAMALEFAHKQVTDPRNIHFTFPGDCLTFGMITVAAMGKEHPDIFKQILHVLQKPDAAGYTKLTSMLLERFGTENVLAMAQFKNGVKYDDFPDFMKDMLPAEYLDGNIPLDCIMPAILPTLKKYEDRTGHSFGIERPTPHNAAADSAEQQESPPPASDQILVMIQKAIETMQ